MLTYNIKLHSINKEDEEFLLETLRNVCDLYDFISDLIYNQNISNNFKSLNIKDVHKLVYKRSKEQFPNIPSQIIIRTEKDVIANYRSIKSNKHKIDKPITKKNLSLRLDKRLYSKFNNKSIKLFSNIRNKRKTFDFILYPKINQMFQNYVPSDPLLFYRNNQLFLSIPFKSKENIPKIIYNNSSIDETNVLGIDRGIRRLVSTSDGLVILGKEFQNHKRKQIFLKKKLKSKNSRTSKKHLKKVKNKEKNFSKNYAHHIVNKLLKTDKQILILEDLSKIKQKTSKNNKTKIKNKKHNRRLSQVPWFLMLSILSYKAPRFGKTVATVSPYMTSQEDHRGTKIGKRVGNRYYTFDGKQFDSDINAAINIKNKYLLKINPTNHPSSQYPSDIAYEGRLLWQGKSPTKSTSRTLKTLISF